MYGATYRLQGGAMGFIQGTNRACGIGELAPATRVERLALHGAPQLHQRRCHTGFLWPIHSLLR